MAQSGSGVKKPVGRGGGGGGGEAMNSSSWLLLRSVIQSLLSLTISPF